MNNRIRAFKSLWVRLDMAIFGAVVLYAVSASACPIPVYQYALENWEPDPYRLVLDQADSVTPEEGAAKRLIEEAVRRGDKFELIEKTDGAKRAAASRLELKFPVSAGNPKVIWNGDLTAQNIHALLDSPVRKRIGDALAKRTTAVWVLLESGEKKVDSELETLLKNELARIEETTMIPESADWGGTTVVIDNQVHFEVIRLRRDDPSEQILVRMLLATEADLESDFAGQPMAFPVYGRGRVLCALVGRGINRHTIRDVADFLTGPCSCQVKAGNPGTDLLLAVDWGARIRSLAPASVGGTTGVGGFLRSYDREKGE